jgi:TRAP-type C4-dicarboxylate transport system substrate-binding protein
VARHYSLNEHTAVPDVLLVSTVVWGDLTERERTWLEEAALESAQYQKVLWQEATEEALRMVEADGVQVMRPDKTPFVEMLTPMYEIYSDEPSVYALIARIQAAVPAAGDSPR